MKFKFIKYECPANMVGLILIFESGRSSAMSEHEVCQVQIEALKEDITEFKKDVREHLKEVRESHKVYTETITIMRENLVRLSGIAERQDDKLDAIYKDIAELKQPKSNENKSTDLSWYQKMIESKEKLFIYVLLILLVFSLGLRTETITGFIGGK